MGPVRVLAVLLALVAWGSAAELSLGGRAGLNLATLSGDVEDEFLTVSPAIHAAVDIELRSSRWLGLQSGLAYTMKGARWSYERENADGEESRAHDDSRVSYLEVPLYLQVRPPVAWKISPAVYVGPALAFFLGAVKSVEVDGEEVLEESRNEGARNVDLGVSAGAAALVALGPGQAFLDVRYTWGLLSVDATGEGYTVNRVLCIALGYRWTVGGRQEP